MFNKLLADFIRSKRLRMGLNQTQMGRLLNMHQQHVSRLEDVNYKSTLDTIERALDILGYEIRIVRKRERVIVGMIKVKLQKDIDRFSRYKKIPILGKIILINMMIDTYVELYHIDFNIATTNMDKDNEQRLLETKGIYETHFNKLKRALMYFSK